jgi:hypothetical protein
MAGDGCVERIDYSYSHRSMGSASMDPNNCISKIFEKEMHLY